MAADYLDVTKNTYKDMICVAKDADSGDIKVQSLAFKVVVKKNGKKMLPFSDHIQDFFYVLVDPMHWHCTLMSNTWKKAW